MQPVINGKVVSEEEFQEMLNPPEIHTPTMEYLPGVQVYAPGSTVLLGNTDLKGRILQINIKLDGISYNVGWWKDSSWYEQWLPEEELTPTAPEAKTTIGFKGELHD